MSRPEAGGGEGAGCVPSRDYSLQLEPGYLSSCSLLQLGPWATLYIFPLEPWQPGHSGKGPVIGKYPVHCLVLCPDVQAGLHSEAWKGKDTLFLFIFHSVIVTEGLG